MSVRTNINSFLRKLRGDDRVRVRNHANRTGIDLLQQKASTQEKKVQRKLHSIVQFVRQRAYATRHNENFNEYRRMDETFPIIKGALDIYAEEITAKDTKGDVIKIISDDSQVKRELEQLFFTNLNINSLAFPIARGMCQFGNQFLFLVTRPGEGIVDCIFLPPEQVIREDMYDVDNLQKYRFQWYGAGGDYFDGVEIAHFRTTEDVELLPYGTSILRPIVETWRRVVLIREALVIYRIVRAPQRLLFKVGTDGLDGDAALAFARDMKKELTKNPLVNPETGEIDFKYNPISIEDNIFMPTFEGDASNVEVLEGASNLDSVEDYKIIKDDLFAGLKVPKAWLTFEEDLSNKAALSEEDVRFAKTSQRYQANFVDELVHLALVHLAHKGFSEKQMTSFSIEMNNPSVASEKRKLELLDSRLELAQKAWDKDNESLNFLSFVDVCRSILKMTDAEIEQTVQNQFVEAKLIRKLRSLREAEDTSLPATERDLLQPKSFDDLKFEAKVLTEQSTRQILEKKIEQELNELFPKVKRRSALGDATLVYEQVSGLMDNLEQTHKDVSQ